MAISGSLEDVSVADVLQFIHLGRRTGTLLLDRGGATAHVGFHRGKLVSSHSPSTPKLGDLLVESGLVTYAELDEAIRNQREVEDGRTLGQILLGNGRLSAESLKDVVSQQIQKAISEVVQWDRGSFEFVIDDLRPIDDIFVYPGDLVPDSDLDTQMMLLEAARIFDEKNHESGERLQFGASAEVDLEAASPRPEGERVSSAALPVSLAELARVEVVSEDFAFVEAIGGALGDAVASVEIVGVQEAGHFVNGGPPPIVLVDVRLMAFDEGDLREILQRRPGMPVVALIDGSSALGPIYSAGALAALPVETDAVVACVENILRSRNQVTRLTQATHDLQSRSARIVEPDVYSRLRRVYGDLRSGLMSATVALNLMHIISESVERAVLFLVKRDSLAALGAFGVGVGGRPLAEATRGLTLSLEEQNLLTASLQRQEVISASYEELNLPPSLHKVVGRPASGQSVIFPVLGAQRVISLIYADNGDLDQPIEDIEILELATAQVGMAFENELLRRQLSQGH